MNLYVISKTKEAEETHEPLQDGTYPGLPVCWRYEDAWKRFASNHQEIHQH